MVCQEGTAEEFQEYKEHEDAELRGRVEIRTSSPDSRCSRPRCQFPPRERRLREVVVTRASRLITRRERTCRLLINATTPAMAGTYRGQLTGCQ